MGRNELNHTANSRSWVLVAALFLSGAWLPWVPGSRASMSDPQQAPAGGGAEGALAVGRIDAPSESAARSGGRQDETAAPETFVPPEGLSNGWYAYIDTTFGRIVIRLLPHQAPQSVAHFAAFADGSLPWFDPVTGEQFELPYFDGTTVQKAFAARRFEAGERDLNGRMAPLRYVPQEGGGPVNFVQAYKVGLTRSSGNRISAAQFFITAASQPFLTPRHPCFGEVVLGMDVVDRICQVKTYSNDRPIEPVVIERVRTFKIGEPDPLPEPELHMPRPSVLELNEDKRRPR